MRGLLHALAEEEERRAAVEATLELSAKEGESVWREELLGLYRETVPSPNPNPDPSPNPSPRPSRSPKP